MTGLGPYLRPAILLDAVASGATGLLLISAADLLSPHLGLPAGLLRPAGALLLPFAAFVAWTGLRGAPDATPAWIVVALNVLWVIDSFALLAWPGLTPTGLGQLFVAAQALAVGGLAAVQALAFRDLGAGRIAA